MTEGNYRRSAYFRMPNFNHRKTATHIIRTRGRTWCGRDERTVDTTGELGPGDHPCEVCFHRAETGR